MENYLKKIIRKTCLLLLSLCAVDPIFGQWKQLTPGYDYYLYDVVFPDINTGYIVASEGTILKTPNGGWDWFKQVSGIDEYLFSAYFVNSDTGYVVGEGGTILKTTNGGVNWNNQDNVTTLSLNSIFFTSEDTGYIVGEFGTILKTTDGGSIWRDLTISDKKYLAAVYFTDSNTGYAVGESGTIIKTIDGGENWLDQDSETTYHLVSVYFPSKDIGFAVGDGGTILKTINGGNTWERMNSNTQLYLNSVYFANLNIGYAVGNADSGILKTSDGGISWNKQSYGEFCQLLSVFFVNADTGYTVGESGTILKTTNGGEKAIGGKDSTFVKGRIIRDADWKVESSPYIIVDTVEVNPDIEIFIEAGVTVKFEKNAQLNLNDARIFAAGTLSDSITFTSDSHESYPGYWNMIRINGNNNHNSEFRYCNFKYAKAAISNNQLFTYNIQRIKNCSFDSNIIGIQNKVKRSMDIGNCNFRNNVIGLYDITNSLIDNCIISNNEVGIQSDTLLPFGGSSVENCIIRSNHIGINGINQNSLIENCIISQNQYGLEFSRSNHVILYGSHIDSNMVSGVNIAGGVSIKNCQLECNGTAIMDHGGLSRNTISKNTIENNLIGIQIGTGKDGILCNSIQNNLSYNIKLVSSENIILSNNYWGTSDDEIIQQYIFDGNDSVGLGLVNITPIDTIQCYSCFDMSLDYTRVLPDSALQNGSATVYPSNGHPPYTYYWNTLPVQTTQTATGLETGIYIVCVTDSTGCTNCINVFLTTPTSINNISSENFAVIFPNPASDIVTLRLNSFKQSTEIKIFNSIGELNYCSTFSGPEINLDISSLKPGLYIIQISLPDYDIKRLKFIKK